MPTIRRLAAGQIGSGVMRTRWFIRPQKANATAFRQWRAWLRGADLTADLWVMRSDSPFDESRTVPSPTRGARHPVSTPSPTTPGAWFGIALSLARRRFHRL
jgi:hypothetical protein